MHLLTVDKPRFIGAIHRSASCRSGMTQIVRIMKITAIILLAACLQVTARTSGQTVTLNLKDAPVQQVFKEVSRQTGVSIVYAESLFKDMKPVTIRVKEASVKDVLNQCLRGQPFQYTLKGNSIVIGPSPTVALQPTVTPPIESEPLPPPIDVTGRVVNEKGEPVVATILVKGTQNGTTSNADGYFELKNVDGNATLVISGVSIETQEVKVNGKTTFAISIKTKVTEGGEVMIKAGYYDVKKSEMTGNISRVDAKTIEKQPVLNPLQAIQGRMPGVYIQQASGIPGSNFEVRIRGRNSIASGNDPLYVIDGVPYNGTSLSTTTTSGSIHGAAGVSPLNSLNPNDIESIEVLKDADATAIYGSRGANGVVLITTKKGNAGKTMLVVNVNSGISQVENKMNLLNTEQYLMVRREAFQNDNQVPAPWDYDINGTWSQDRYTDWQEVLIGGTAKSINTQMSLSGGNTSTQFFFSSGYQKQTTVFPGDFAYSKWSTHLSVNHVSTNGKLNAAFSVNYITDKNNLVNNDFTSRSLSLAPNAPELYDGNGKLNWENSTWINPLAAIENKYKANSATLLGNAVISYKISDDFEFKSNVGFNSVHFKDRNMFPSTAVNPALGLTSSISRLQFNNNEIKFWITEPQLSYKRNIGKGKLSVLAGTTFQEQISEQIVQIGVGFSSDALIENIAAASFKAVSQYNYNQYRYNAFFSRFNFDWDKKYILNLTGRRDGSSRFGPGKQFANFGAVGMAWIFTREAFFKDKIKALNFGKLRISYGTTGNDQIGDYEYLNNYTTGSQYQGITSLGPVRLYNPDFMWEVTKKFETALELGFLNDKLLLSLAYFKNRSSNQLIGYSLPATTGFTSIRSNFPATVQNTAVEIEVSSINFRRNNFEWRSALNITFPENKLLEFPGIESSTYRNTYEVGKPLNISKRYHLLGIDPSTGIFQFEDMNRDGSITSLDRLAIKEIGQSVYGGLNNSLIYKGLKFDIFFQFVKQTAPDFFANSGIAPGGSINQPDVVLSRWSPNGNSYLFQRFTAGYNFSALDEFDRYSLSDATIVDASFIRLKNISLSYELPAKFTQKFKANVYLQGQNVWTITNYIGPDPENFGRSVLPPLRSFVAGILLTF